MTPTNRLEQMIRRLTAQRNCLAFAAEMVVDLPGPVLEFGLGKGRTYDFMRECLPERDIYGELLSDQDAEHTNAIGQTGLNTPL